MKVNLLLPYLFIVRVGIKVRNERGELIMLHNKKLIAIVLVCVLLGLAQLTAAASMIDEKTTLTGQVTWTVPVGQSVTEGSELVRVSTLTGSAAASRATTAGTVQEVLVKPGDNVKSGEIVVRIAK